MNNEQSLDYWKQRAQVAEVKLAVYGEIVSQLVHGNDAKAYLTNSRTTNRPGMILDIDYVTAYLRGHDRQGRSYEERFDFNGDRHSIEVPMTGIIRLGLAIR
jgi:hypothetical protein